MDRHKINSVTRQKQSLLKNWDELRFFIKALIEKRGIDIPIVKEER